MAQRGASYADALAGVRAVLAREAADPRINPECHSLLLEHGLATPRAIVFLHGITSGAFQFQKLGELFHERGYNVFIPRMPRHGYRDRMNRDQGLLSRAEQRAYSSEAVDIGRGLGTHLTVSGLSVSGTLAAWCFQHRAEVDLAVPIAPAFAPAGIPIGAVPALAGVTLALPDTLLWWDLRQRSRLGPPCGYPRFSTHALAESFLLGYQIYQTAREEPPSGRAVLAITNPRDSAVNNSATTAVLARWRTSSSAAVRHYQFGRELGPLHDIIGPFQPNAQVDYVYPILFDLIQAAGA